MRTTKMWSLNVPVIKFSNVRGLLFDQSVNIIFSEFCFFIEQWYLYFLWHICKNMGLLFEKRAFCLHQIWIRRCFATHVLCLALCATSPTLSFVDSCLQVWIVVTNWWHFFHTIRWLRTYHVDAKLTNRMQISCLGIIWISINIRYSYFHVYANVESLLSELKLHINSQYAAWVIKFRNVEKIYDYIGL